MGTLHDSSGNQIGYIDDGAGAAVLGFLAVIGFAIYFLYGFVQNWSDYSFPFDMVAAIYYYVLFYPFVFISYIFNYVSSGSVTRFQNLNLVFGVISCMAYIAVVGFGVYRTVVFAGKKLVIVLVIPAVVAAVWGAALWLFA